ncbi:MAG: hypothetical protein WBP85_13180, partial [Terracidiphilus sp.]
MVDQNLDTVDLVVDEVYGGSRRGNSSDDPLPKLLGVDNSAGFRHLGKRPHVATLKLIALKTSFADGNWPDYLDREGGRFIYYGDNHGPKDLHSTPRQGNLILRNLFDEAHNTTCSAHFPPILVFGNAGVYRDVRFLGLAVPGAEGFGSDDDLVAVWRTTQTGIRFQNYKAVFTILDVQRIPRIWIDDIKQGTAVSSLHSPSPWLDWVTTRKFKPLKSQPIKSTRNKQMQLPEAQFAPYLDMVYGSFKDDPFKFEKCSVEIAKLFLPDIHHEELTRPWRDGGRDAVGLYRIGRDAG